MSPTPLDISWSDQVLAIARDAALDPGTLPVAVTAADGKSRCSWCDCADGPDSPHNDAAYRCDGCPETATEVVSVYNMPGIRHDFPSCRRHYPEVVAQIVHGAAGTR